MRASVRWNMRRYAFSALLVVLAVTLEIAVKPIFRGRTPQTLFTVAVTFAAAYGGLGPGLFATALSAVAVEFLFLDSIISLLPGLPSVWTFAFLGSAISIVIDGVRRQNLTVANTKALLEASNTELAKRSNDLIRTNEKLQRLAAIVEGSEDAIIGNDPNGVVLTWNAAAERMYGYGAAEAKGRLMSSLLRPDRPHEEDEILNQVKQGIHVEHFETVHIKKNGQAISVSLTISPIRDAGSTVIGASHIVRDISEHKKIEEHLRQAQKLESLGVLAGGISHDFNNLLTGILGNTSLALEMLHPTHPAHETLRNAIVASERAADLTRQLLAYAGKGRFVIGPVNLSALIREISELVRASVPGTVELVLELADDLPYIDADASQLQQLIMNLVINGAEAIGEHKTGTVRVTTGAREVDADYIARVFGGTGEILPGSYVTLQVRDNGCGMDDVTLARIFDPFFTTKFTGRGLGLAAVQGIIRSHKAALKVSSEPGKFTEFQVYLPATRQQVAAETRRPVTEGLTGKATILLIDDEAAVRQAARLALEHYGYTVLVAENGKDGVELFRRAADKVSLVILDMTMPVMSGEETCRNLKRIAPRVKVMLSSGYEEAEAVERFTERELAGFLQKPYSATVLAQSVKKALETGISQAGRASQAG